MEDNNTLTWYQKLIAGILLAGTTFFAIYFIIGYWPDKLPAPGGTAVYHSKLFHVELIDTSFKIDVTLSTGRLKKASDTSRIAKKDTIGLKIQAGKKDTSVKLTLIDTAENKLIVTLQQPTWCNSARHTIQLNTLLLILVALGGFLGNMIHIATSFTTFVGANKFVKSWLLWYLVKPFTASALAIVLYFVFRAGFLNYSNDASNINLFGIMTIAMLAGLFTDKATLKLKEIFEVVFKVKEDRPNTLTGATVTSITPDIIKTIGPTDITINGSGLDGTLIIKIDGVQQTISANNITASSIKFSYTPPAEATANVTKYALNVFDKNNKPLFSKTFTAG